MLNSSPASGSKGRPALLLAASPSCRKDVFDPALVQPQRGRARRCLLPAPPFRPVSLISASRLVFLGRSGHLLAALGFARLFTGQWTHRTRNEKVKPFMSNDENQLRTPLKTFLVRFLQCDFSVIKSFAWWRARGQQPPRREGGVSPVFRCVT